MAYVQKQNRFNLPKTGRGLGSGLLMKSGSPLAEVQFPIGPKTKLKSYEGLLNKKDGSYAAAGSEEAKQMYAEAKRTGDYSILEGVTNTNKLGLQSNFDNINRPNFSVSPQVRNAISGLSENTGLDRETGVFNPGTLRQNERAGQFSNDLAEMIMGYNVGNTPKNNRISYGYNRDGNPIAPNVPNSSIPFDQGIATTNNGEDIFTTARAGVGRDEFGDAYQKRGVFGKRRDKDGNQSLISRSTGNELTNDVTRLIQQNLNFNRRLNNTGAFTLSEFRDELQENPNAFYATPRNENSFGISERGTRNPGNRASLPNIRDNYMNYDVVGEQQRLSSTGADYNNRNDYFNTGQSPRAEFNFTKYLEDQISRIQGEPLNRRTNPYKYKLYENVRDIQGNNEVSRQR